MLQAARRHLSALCIPDAHILVFRNGHYPCAVRSKLHRRNGAVMLQQFWKHASGFGFTYLYDVAVQGRCKPMTILTELGDPAPAIMLKIDRESLASGGSGDF